MADRLLDEQRNIIMDKNTPIPYEQAQKLAQMISEQHHIDTYDSWLVLTGKITEKKVLSFEEVREIVRNLKLKNAAEYMYSWSHDKLYLLPHDLPCRPPEHYKNEWTSWGDFLGTGHKIPSRFRPFNEAVLYVRDLCIKNCKEWQLYCDLEDRPNDIPHSPQKIYKDEWQGWNYFFGIGLYRQELYLDTPEEELLETIEDDIVWDLHNIGCMLEIFREETDLDEEILEKYKDEPKLFLKGLKEYLKKYPRLEEDEE